MPMLYAVDMLVARGVMKVKPRSRSIQKLIDPLFYKL